MDKFGSVNFSVTLDYNLDDYADGNEWNRDELIDMVRDVFMEDIQDMLDNGLFVEWVDVKEVDNA